MWTLGLRNLRGEVGRNMRAEYDGRLKVIEALLVSIILIVIGSSYWSWWVGGIKNEKGSFGGSG